MAGSYRHVHATSNAAALRHALRRLAALSVGFGMAVPANFQILPKGKAMWLTSGFASLDCGDYNAGARLVLTAGQFFSKGVTVRHD
jgi:hypothetical protein